MGLPSLAFPAPGIRDVVKPLMLASMAGWLLLTILTWPMPLHPLTTTLEGLYHDGHVWCFQYMAGAVFGGSEASMIGFPHPVDLQFIGWGAALLVAPLQGLLGPVGAYNASFYVSATLNIFGIGLLLRLLGSRPWPAAAAALFMSFCPFALEALSNGQVAKFQLWVLALHLLLVWAVLRGWWRLPLMIPVTLLLAYTSPTLAMSLPMVLAILVPIFVWSSPRRVPSALLGGAAIAITGLCLIWASGSYDLASQQSGLVADLQGQLINLLGGVGSGTDESQAAFFPASVTPGDYQAIIDTPESSWRRSWKVSRIDTIFLGGADIYSDHVPFVGVVGLVICGLLSRRRFRGRAVGWFLTVSGVVLSFGPQLANSEGFVLVLGHTVAMPAALLDAMGYPVGSSGMYHRFLMLASLGMAILLSCGLSARVKTGRRLPWLLALLFIAEGLLQSRARWPRPSNPVEGLASYRAMAEDPVPGAVVALPLRVNDTGAGSQIMLAAYHGRTTSGLLRYDSWEQDSTLQLRQWFDEANKSRDPSDHLAVKGVRYVVWTPWVQHETDRMNLRYLTQVLGSPQLDGELRWWKLEENGEERRRRGEVK